MLIGLPGCGKSTFVNQRLDSGIYDFVPAPTVLSTDNYIESCAVRDKKLYSEVFYKYIGEAETALSLDLKNALDLNHDIIWDQTNLSVKARAKKLVRIPKSYKRIAVVFEVAPEELQRRLDKRCKETGKWINPDVIENMRKNYERPSKSEGFDVIIYREGGPDGYDY